MKQEVAFYKELDSPHTLSNLTSASSSMATMSTFLRVVSHAILA